MLTWVTVEVASCRLVLSQEDCRYVVVVSWADGDRLLVGNGGYGL